MNHGTIKPGLLAFALLLGGRAGAGETKPPAKAAASQPRAAKADAKAKDETRLIELNGATKAQLMTLPDITADYADKIIKGRPYNSKADLVSHHVIPTDLYPGLHALVRVQPKPLKK